MKTKGQILYEEWCGNVYCWDDCFFLQKQHWELLAENFKSQKQDARESALRVAAGVASPEFGPDDKSHDYIQGRSDAGLAILALIEKGKKG